MYEVYDEVTKNLLKKCHTLNSAKEFCKTRFGDEVWFDGDPDLGASTIYVWKNSDAEDTVAYIELPDEND